MRIIRIIIGILLIFFSITSMIYMGINKANENIGTSILIPILLTLWGIGIIINSNKKIISNEIPPKTNQPKIDTELEVDYETAILNIYNNLPIDEQAKILHYAKYIKAEYEATKNKK